MLPLFGLLFLIQTVVGQELPWNLCQEEKKNVFCLGGKKDVSSLSGAGCFLDQSCEAWVVGVIDDKKVNWKLMVVDGKLRIN